MPHDRMDGKPHRPRRCHTRVPPHGNSAFGDPANPPPARRRKLTGGSFGHMFGTVMGRPPVPRRVGCRFRGRGFRPIGRPARGLPAVVLGLDELEALRLADLEGLYQEEAARRMGISRPTFGRILSAARRKVARALVEQHLLLIGEGPIVSGDVRPCCERPGGGGPKRGPETMNTPEPLSGEEKEGGSTP